MGLTEQHLSEIAQIMSSFFVRRNLTGTPQTYRLPAIFMDIAAQSSDLCGEEVTTAVRDHLRRESASDAVFREKLSGPIYVENSDVARFILVSLAEGGMTKENWKDLWEKDANHYRWTIEHILPQGENLPEAWIEMLGGESAHAKEIQQTYVHTLGNLTLTGYNSNLGNKSFDEKKRRQDSNGNYIGFRNGLRLNADVSAAEIWTDGEIRARTEKLATATMELFPI